MVVLWPRPRSSNLTTSKDVMKTPVLEPGDAPNMPGEVLQCWPQNNSDATFFLMGDSDSTMTCLPFVIFGAPQNHLTKRWRSIWLSFAHPAFFWPFFSWSRKETCISARSHFVSVPLSDTLVWYSPLRLRGLIAPKISSGFWNAKFQTSAKHRLRKGFTWVNLLSENRTSNSRNHDVKD